MTPGAALSSVSEHIRGVYERLAPAYDRSQWITEVLLLRRLRRRLLSRLRSLTGCQVLEIGIGTGANLGFYPQHSVITGVDLSRAMLERALAKAHRLGRQLTVQLTDAEDLPFRDATFDAAVSTLTLCTTPNPLRLLGEIARVCRPGGHIYLLEHGLSTSRPLNWALRRLAPGHLRRHACHLTRDMAALPDQAHLTVLHMERHLSGVFVLVEGVVGLPGHPAPGPSVGL